MGRGQSFPSVNTGSDKLVSAKVGGLPDVTDAMSIKPGSICYEDEL